MVQSIQDHPQFIMEGSRGDTMIVTEILTHQDTIGKDQLLISKGIPPIINRGLCKVEGTMDLHKLMAHQDKEITEALYQ